jgi:hypothetical protein
MSRSSRSNSRTRTIPRVLGAIALTLLCATTARAQEQPPPRDSGSHWMVGGTVIIPRGAAGYASVGLTAGSTRAARPGLDLAAVIVPRALTEGFVMVGVRANIAVPIAIGRSALLVPSVGATLLGAAGVLGPDGARGYNGTLALMLFDKPLDSNLPALGFRAAVATHRLGDLSPGSVHMLELGFVRRGR